MTAGTPQKFIITPAQFETLVEKAAAAGVPITNAAAGQAEAYGVTVAWTYDGATLTVTVMSRSFFDPSVADIQARIAELVTSNG
jgi:hypothetical protein